VIAAAVSKELQKLSRIQVLKRRAEKWRGNNVEELGIDLSADELPEDNWT
jgi:hypothetical protein